MLKEHPRAGSTSRSAAAGGSPGTARASAPAAARSTGPAAPAGSAGLRTCRGCGAELPLTPEHFWRKGQASDGTQLFYKRCKTCQAPLNARYSAASRERMTPERLAERRRKDAERARRKRATEEGRLKNVERCRRWRAAVAKSAERRRREREAQRIRHRLRAERAGRAVVRSARVIDEKAAQEPLLPAGPLAEFIERMIAAERARLNWLPEPLRRGHDNFRESVCARLGIDARTLYAWRKGQREGAHLDVVDRVLTRSPYHWWDVYDPAEHPEVARIMEAA